MLKTVNTPVGPVSVHIQSDDWNCELRNNNPLPGMSCHSFRCRATSLPYSVTRFQSSGVTVSVKDLRSQGTRARDDAGHFVCDEFVAL